MSSLNSNSGGCTYRFIESSLATLPEQINYDIEIRQQPKHAKISLINERDRRPIEPPPILQLHWENCSDEELKKCLQSPFYFTVANLVTEQDPETPLLPVQNYLSGSTVSSLYRLRDIDNSDGGFFVFGDLAVKKEGKFKLRFSLFEIVEGQVQNRKTILSDTFTVFLPKHFPGPVEATFLSRTFSDQGVKMRIRKEHRLQSRKRKLENLNDDSSSYVTDSTPSVKKYQTKKSTNMIVSSPPYAESSSSTAPHSDVFFGRWQATTAKYDHRQQQHHYSSSGHTTPPPSQQQHQMNEEPDYKGLTNKFRYQQSDPTKAFPSPESTIYTTNNPSSSNSQSYNNNRARSLSWGQQQHKTTKLEETTPSLIASNHFIESPPQMSMQLPPPSSSSSSLAKYHTYSDNSNHYKNDRLPTPPSSITEITGNHTWGTQLPPLRSIMNGIRSHPQQATPPPFILPPPTPTMMMDHSLHHQRSSSATSSTSLSYYHR